MGNRKTWVKLNDAGGSVLLSQRKVVCPETCTLGFGKLEARAGDILKYWPNVHTNGMGYLARVLGVVDDVKPASEYPGISRGDLLVLQLASDGTFAYLRVVKPAQVRYIHGPERLALLAWFARPDLADDPASVCNYAAYGSLSASYIEDHCQNGKLVPWQDGIGRAPQHRNE